MQARKIKWGILGTSWISNVMAEAIKASTTSELIAIGSRDKIKASQFATTHQLSKYYDDYEALLMDHDIDAVYIGLPNHLHKEWIIQCAKAGKHILCEKPFVLDPHEARDVLHAVKQHRVFCMEALMYHCHPSIKELQDLIDTNVIGDIKHISAIYTANIADVANKTAGGAIRNLGCYPVSLMRLLTKEEPISITTQGQSSSDHTTETALFRFNNGIVATITTADNLDMYSQFTIMGTKGTISFKSNPWLPDKNNEIMLKTEKKETILNFKADKGLYTYQIDIAAEHINNGVFNPKAPGVSWEHSVGNVKALDSWLKADNGP